MNHVVGRFATEQLADHFARKQASLVNLGPATTGEISTGGFPLTVELDPVRILPANHPPRVWRTDAKHAVVVGCGVGHRRRGHKGIAAQVTVRQRQVGRNRRSTSRRETITDRVHPPAEGPHGSGHRLNRRPVGLDAKIGPSQRDGCLQFGTADCPSITTRTHVNPVVESPPRVVDPSFNELASEPGQQGLTNLGAAVTVAIGQEQDVRSTHNHQAISRWQEAITRRQPIGPHPRRVHPAIAIGIDQQFDRTKLSSFRLLGNRATDAFPANATDRSIDRARLVQFRHINLAFEIEPVNLSNEHPSTGVKGNTRGLDNNRFTRNQFDTEPLGQPELANTRSGRQWQRWFWPGLIGCTRLNHAAETGHPETTQDHEPVRPIARQDAQRCQ